MLKNSISLCSILSNWLLIYRLAIYIQNPIKSASTAIFSTGKCKIHIYNSLWSIFFWNSLKFFIKKTSWILISQWIIQEYFFLFSLLGFGTQITLIMVCLNWKLMKMQITRLISKSCCKQIAISEFKSPNRDLEFHTEVFFYPTKGWSDLIQIR